MMYTDFAAIDNWDDLVEFCDDYDLCACENIYDQEQLVDYISHIIETSSTYNALNHISSLMDGFDINTDYYERDIDDYFNPLENGDVLFEECKDNAKDEYELNYTWDEEDEEDEDDGTDEPPAVWYGEEGSEDNVSVVDDEILEIIG